MQSRIENFPQKKSPCPDGLSNKCFKTLKKELIPILQKIVQTIEKEETL